MKWVVMQILFLQILSKEQVLTNMGKLGLLWIILHSWSEFIFLDDAVNLATLASTKFAIKAK